MQEIINEYRVGRGHLREFTLEANESAEHKMHGVGKATVVVKAIGSKAYSFFTVHLNGIDTIWVDAQYDSHPEQKGYLLDVIAATTIVTPIEALTFTAVVGPITVQILECI